MSTPRADLETRYRVGRGEDWNSIVPARLAKELEQELAESAARVLELKRSLISLLEIAETVSDSGLFTRPTAIIQAARIALAKEGLP